MSDGTLGAIVSYVSIIQAPPFEIPQAALNFYREMVSLVEQNKIDLIALPKQLVHHDVLVYNLL